MGYNNSMTYTLGVFENALKQISDRLTAHKAAGERLVDIKSIVIGHRPISL